jgi:hypothetical protein
MGCLSENLAVIAQPKFAYHDYEYTGVSEPTLRLVSCAVLSDGVKDSIWLDGDEKNQERLRAYYLSLPKGTVLVAFNVEAEARSMLDLGIDPLQFEWIDLYLEFLMLMNHNNEIGFGEHYVDGRVVKLRPFKDKKPNGSLATALFKMLKIKIDTDHKDAIRDLIISDPARFTDEQRRSILEYGEGDVVHLPELHRAIWAYYGKRLPKSRLRDLFDQAKKRARYAVRTAAMVKRGYPIQVDWAANLSASTGALIDSLIRDIISQFPGDKNLQPFYWNKKECRWSMDQTNVRAWIVASGNAKGWPLTKGGKLGDKKQLSLSGEDFEDRFSFSHTYPRGHYGAQLVRYFKLKQSLNGFTKPAKESTATGTKKKKKFFDYLGSDGRVRPYFNIFGAQSSRTQPASTGFIMLKPAWQRALIKPRKGKMIVGCDMSSEEFLLSALILER